MRSSGLLVPGNSEMVLDLAMLSLARNSEGAGMIRVRQDGAEETVFESRLDASAPLHTSLEIMEPGRYLIEIALS